MHTFSFKYKTYTQKNKQTKKKSWKVLLFQRIWAVSSNTTNITAFHWQGKIKKNLKKNHGQAQHYTQHQPRYTLSPENLLDLYLGIYLRKTLTQSDSQLCSQ